MKNLSQDEIIGYYYCESEYERYIDLKKDSVFIYGYKDIGKNQLECYGKWEKYKKELILHCDLPVSGECAAITSFPGNSWEVKVKNKNTILLGPFEFKRKVFN